MSRRILHLRGYARRRCVGLVPRHRRAALLALALVVSAAAVNGPAWAAQSDGADGPRRFAVVVGNNDGGPGTERLLYAHDDARRIHDLLVRLGGVAPADARLLLEADADDVLSTLDRLGARAAAAAARGEATVLLLYYSGHAKDRALRLGDEALPIDAVRDRLRAVPADVRIGILDACRSGSVRTKGARRAPAFEVEGAAAATRGLVVLTSSSADEDSQESDHLGGSYFTHHLAGGLMGAADQSGDGRVTLAEAYAYAYARTVAETAATLAGPQHPTFAYDLHGAGDVVLTDLQRPEGLVLPAAAPGGTYFLVSEGHVVAEVAKPAGQARRVALAPGRYAVKRRLDDHLRLGHVRVPSGREVVLDEGRLRDASFSDDPVKGVGRHRREPTGWLVTAGVQSFFAAPELFPGTGLIGVEGELPGVFGPGWRLGFDVAFGGRDAVLALEGLAPEPYRYGSVNLGLSLVRQWPMGRWTPFAGGRLAMLFLSRDFASDALPDQFFSTAAPGLVGGLKLRLAGPFAVAARARVHYLHYNVDENRSLGYWEAGLLLVFEP